MMCLKTTTKRQKTLNSEQKDHEMEELLTNSFHIGGMLCEMQILRSNSFSYSTH